ncbi:hypothetical protein ABPG73_019882 [Tetrahymena malaccensis]
MSNNNQKSNQGQYQNNKNNVKQSQYQQSDAFQNNQTNKKQENNERNIKTWNNNNQRNTQEEDKQNCNMKNNIKSQNKSKNQQFQNKQKNTSNQSQKENIEYVRKDNQQQNYLNQTSQNIIVDNNLQNYDKSSLLNETNNKMQDNQKIQTIKKNINKQSQKKNIEYVLKDNQQQNYQIQASQNLIVDNNQQNYDKTSLLNETNNNQHIQTIKKNTNKQSQKENIEYVRKDNQQQNYQSQNSQNLIVDNNQYNYDKTSLRNQHNNKMQDNQQILNKQKNINNQSQKQNIEYVRKDIQQQNDQTQVQLNQANQNILLDNNLQNYVKKSLHNEHNNKMPDNQQILDKQKNINNQSQKQNIEYVRKDNQQQNYLNQANKNLIVGNNQQNNDQISLHNEQNNQKLSDQQNTVRMFFNQQKLNNQNKYSNKIYFYEKKQESEQKIFVQQFLKNYLGLEKKKQNDKNQYNCYEFERLSMYKNLCYQFRKEFKQQIQQTIKFIEDWVQGNQSLIEKNQNNEQAYKKIQIFTSNFINLTKKLDQILIQSYEKLLKNQNLDDCSNQNDLLYILNEKKKQEEAENLDELNEIKELQNIQQIQRNENDHDSNSEIMSQKTFRSVQFDEDSALNSSFSSFQTHDSQNNESSKLNKEQKQKYQKFCWKIFHGFKKCLSIELAMNKRNLPAYQVGQEIQSLLEICQNPFILLMGSTGSGKTTQTPQILYQHQLMDVEKSNKVIYCVQPRKINCLTISERVANEMGCKLGEEVGYQVGYSACEQKFDRYKTKIIFITESLLMGMLVKQNKQKQKQNKKDFFQHCSYIILDEVHERSVKSDIIMGLAKTIFSEQTKIKFFLSSATADREMYLKYFTQLPIIEIPGKIYPVDEEFIVEEGSSVTKVIKHLNVVIDRIEQDVELHNGHMLVFMMDGQEIDECIKQATSLPKLDLHKYKLLPLHSRLERDQQELVFKEHFNDDDKQMKKIIFCTNIAETAITINNITIVIDCGMEKVAQFDPRKNITTIQSTFISKSSAKQRQGRAGRTCPGICYKLYSEEEYESFANEKIPEISRINIEQVLLQIIESGEKVETFPYFEKPDQTILKCSKDNLIRLGAIDEMNNSLTEIGRIMQKSELEPYQIKCLIDAYKLNVINEVTNILAVMPEIGGLFKREENQKQNTFYEKNGIKNEYNSDFLNYHNIFESIKILNKQSQCKKSLKENNIKYYVWQNILTSRYNIIRFRKKLETKHSEVLQNKQNQNQEDNTEVKVLKVMLNAYINQISIFSGIKYLGFIDMKSNIQFRIHPQSQYSRQNFDRGAILIYGNLEDREKSTYAKHISEIKFEWLKDQNLFNEEIYQRIKESKEEAQKNNFHHQIKASNFMIDQFRKLHFTKIKEKFLEYQDIYPKAKSFLILDTEQCLIKVASTKEGQIHYEQRQIGKYIEDLVNKERQIHRKRVIIRKFKESENYAVIGEGYKIIDILLPNQFVKVKVANIPTKNEYGEEITKNYIEKQFKLKNNNDYYDLYIHKSEKSSYAQIQFLTYESARKFVKNVNLDIISNSKAITVVGIPESNVKKNLFEKYSLNVYIPIDKPTGVGYLNFQNEIDRDETLEHLKNQQFNAQQCEKKVNGNLEYQIKLNNLLIHQNEEYLEKHVQQTQGGFINAVIIRKKSDSFDSDQEQIQLQQTYLRSYVTSIVLKEDIPIPLKGDIQCQICYEQKNLERLDQCGCLFCKECILEYIVNFCSQFEVLCCPNHKDNPITLEDSYEIINCIEQDTIIEKKINDKIDGWKNLQDQLKFIRCPTANCDSFFGRVYKLPNGTYLDQSIPQNIRCSECYQSFCLLKTDARDKNSFVHECHQGNCENFQINQQYIEQMLLNENGRYCPTCKAPIIKNGGCDHMTCKSCGTHFCWKCVQVFDEAEIYKHLKICQKSN